MLVALRWDMEVNFEDIRASTAEGAESGRGSASEDVFSLRPGKPNHQISRLFIKYLWQCTLASIAG